MSLASLLNTTITLQRKTATKDASLGTGFEWTDVESYCASVQPVSANEAWKLAQRNIFVSHVIYLDQNISATVRDRISWDSRLFNIVHVFDMAGRTRVYRLGIKEQS